jgi:selenium metabolism protein YedF
MKKQVDARGLACPQPVIITKKALEELEKGEVVAVVDNEIAKNNVVKLAKSMNCSVNIEKINNEYHIGIIKGEPVEIDESLDTSETSSDVYLITTDELGKGSRELGTVLMKSFMYSLSEQKQLPRSMIFINSGVRLTTEGSEVIDTLKVMENRGVEILSCGTCLDYYNLKDKLLIGGVTNMYTIVEKLMEVQKVINI